MATSFQNTHFNPQKSSVNVAHMEESLAREMARLKMEDERKQREMEMVCAQSDELKELQMKIKNAYLNKERAAQITECQYRQQVEIVSLQLLTAAGARRFHRQVLPAKEGDRGPHGARVERQEAGADASEQGCHPGPDRPHQGT